jgi:glycosyltransferase involved in cell wall biosynthesis
MKLLYTLTSYPPAVGGAQLHQHLIARQLSAQHQVQVVTHWDENRTDWLRGTTVNAPSESKNYQVEGISVHRLGISRATKARLLPAAWTYYLLMNWAIQQISTSLYPCLESYAKNADLIHNVRIGREGLSYASLQTARKLGIPFVLTPVHHPRWTGWKYREYLKIYCQADAVIALTHNEKQVLANLGVSSDKIHVTGHGPILAEQANPSDFRQQHHIKGPVVLFLGQHYAYKGYREVLAAMKIVWQTVPDAEFVFIGPEVKSSEAIFAAYTDPRVHRLGRVELQTKTDALAACDILCVPSTQESFGGVYTEAWSFSKPVIGCPIPAVREVVSDGVDGCLVQQDPTQITDALTSLLRDDALRERMGQAGKAKVEANYDWKMLANKTQKVYKHLVSGG